MRNMSQICYSAFTIFSSIQICTLFKGPSRSRLLELEKKYVALIVDRFFFKVGSTIKDFLYWSFNRGIWHEPDITAKIVNLGTDK